MWHTESQIKPKGASLIYLHKRMQWMEGSNYLLWDGDKTKYKKSLEQNEEHIQHNERAGTQKVAQSNKKT